MIGIIDRVPSETFCFISAPYVGETVHLHRRHLNGDVHRFRRSMIGQPVTFDLVKTYMGLQARNAWLASCDVAAAAELNREA